MTESLDAPLDKDYPPVAEKTICLDYDGTLFKWGHPAMGPKEPFPGVADAMRRLRREGWQIVIFTSRLSKTWAKSVVGPNGWAQALFLDKQHAYISQTLREHDIPFDLITSEKVPAEAYIDDRAWRVNGFMPTALVISNFLAGRQ